MRIHSTDGGSALTSLSSRLGPLRYRSSTSGSSRSTYSEASASNASRIQVVLPMPRAPKRKNELACGAIRAGWFGLRRGDDGHRQRAGDADGTTVPSSLLTAGGTSRYSYAMAGIRSSWASFVVNRWYSRVVGHMQARGRPMAVARRSPGSEAMPAVSGALSAPAGAAAAPAAAPLRGLTDITRAESREPRAESREPRAESREPRAESREPRAESREPRAESREPRAESREPRAESREPRAESREPRAESREPSPLHVRRGASCLG